MHLNKTYQEVKPLIDQAHGWMGSQAQREFMFNLAKISTCAAEIGTYKGLSAAIVGLGMKGHGQYYCIDTYEASNAELANCDTYSEFMEMRRRLVLDDTLVPVRGFSYQPHVLAAVPNELDFVYIDGDHEADSVYQDFKLWAPKVRKGGLILAHDVTWESVGKGIRRATAEGIVVPWSTWADFGVFKRSLALSE